MLRQSDRNDYLPLCFRCHHRARFLESGGVEEARYECGQIEHAVVGCYMFRPCRPFALRPEQGDKRPVGAAWTLSARVNAVEPRQTRINVRSPAGFSRFSRSPPTMAPHSTDTSMSTTWSQGVGISDPRLSVR